MKPSLEHIQTDFQDYIRGPLEGTPAIAASIAEQFGLSASDRLSIYYNAYRIRIREALSDAFSKTHSYLGDDLFEELSAAYIDQYPSQYRNLRWYGDRFAEYLTHALEEHPIVAELATFKWALGVTFDAEDASVLTAADIGTLTPEQWESVGFTLQPSVQFLSMHTNAVAIWLALDQEQTPPDVLVSEQSTQWLVWRKELQPHFRSLDSYEANALQGLKQGKSFSAVCEDAAESANDEDVMTRIAGWLQSWLLEAILSQVYLTE